MDPQPLSPAAFDSSERAARQRTGDAAEVLVWRWLKLKYGDGFVTSHQWLSSARERLLPPSGVLQPADDTVGYDFWLVDRQEWLVEAQGGVPVKCYIEVKVSCLAACSPAAAVHVEERKDDREEHNN